MMNQGTQRGKPRDESEEWVAPSPVRPPAKVSPSYIGVVAMPEI